MYSRATLGDDYLDRTYPEILSLYDDPQMLDTLDELGYDDTMRYIKRYMTHHSLKISDLIDYHVQDDDIMVAVKSKEEYYRLCGSDDLITFINDGL